MGYWTTSATSTIFTKRDPLILVPILILVLFILRIFTGMVLSLLISVILLITESDFENEFQCVLGAYWQPYQFEILFSNQ